MEIKLKERTTSVARSVGGAVGKGLGLLSIAAGWTLQKTHNAMTQVMAAPGKVLDKIEEKCPKAAYVTQPLRFVGHYMYRGFVITLLFMFALAPPLAFILALDGGLGAAILAFLVATPALIFTLATTAAVWGPLLQLTMWVGLVCMSLDIMGLVLVQMFKLEIPHKSVLTFNGAPA